MEMDSDEESDDGPGTVVTSLSEKNEKQELWNLNQIQPSKLNNSVTNVSINLDDTAIVNDESKNKSDSDSDEDDEGQNMAGVPKLKASVMM